MFESLYYYINSFVTLSVMPRFVIINNALEKIILLSFLLSVCSLNGLNLYNKNIHMNVLNHNVNA